MTTTTAPTMPPTRTRTTQTPTATPTGVKSVSGVESTCDAALSILTPKATKGRQRHHFWHVELILKSTVNSTITANMVLFFFGIRDDECTWSNLLVCQNSSTSTRR